MQLNTNDNQQSMCVFPQEKLTALGKHMANLPVDPKIAKMIIYGTIFRFGLLFNT